MRRLLIIPWLLLASACAAGAGTGPPPHPDLWVENGSQFVLLELRTHREARYQDAPNVLTDPLVPGARFILPMAQTSFVTVFREHYRLGPTIALTTSEALDADEADGGVLTVFDDYFRFEP